MDLATIAPWAVTGISGGVGFLAVKWFVEWLSGRMDRRRDELDEGMMSLLTALQKQVADQDVRIERIEKENAELRRRIDGQRERERTLEDENEELRKDIKDLETRLHALEELVKGLPETPELQAQIERLDKMAPKRRTRKGGP
jgi:septal ring factor EnvC (AmiA/AmiB activator)